jgi:upstream activation factor subunit UAF30
MKRATKKTNGGNGKQARGKAAARTQKKRGAGLQQPVEPDEELSAVVGERAQPRTQMVKRIWEYIRSHKLQDPKDKRMIVVDETLAPLFGNKKRVSMFEIASMLNRHVRPAEG